MVIQMTKFGRRSALSLVTGLFLTCFVSTSALADPAKDAGNFIQQLADKVISIIAGKGNDAEEVRRFGELFSPSIDVPEVGRLVLGRHWRQATPQQQQEFLSLFEQMNVLIWSKRFDEYSGETLQVLSSKPDNKRFIVDSLIRRPSGKPVSVQWAVHQSGGSFKIVDITVEGVSMVITNRSDYASAIQSQGGKIDGLLASMRQRVASMKAERGLP